jgi:hypothetical protein
MSGNSIKDLFLKQSFGVDFSLSLRPPYLVCAAAGGFSASIMTDDKHNGTADEVVKVSGLTPKLVRQGSMCSRLC